LSVFPWPPAAEGDCSCIATPCCRKIEKGVNQITMKGERETARELPVFVSKMRASACEGTSAPERQIELE
jgi:hypothetical protein